MRHRNGIAAIVAAAGLCAPALAQDSTSINAGDLPGDALSPWAESCSAYVVDLTPFNTTKGYQFGIAPLVKMTKVNTTNFNNLFSSSSISSGIATGVNYSMPAYSLWENTPGAGVHPTNNSAPGMVTPSGQSTRFAVAVNDFGTTTGGTSFNGIVGALVNFDPADANRLYVDRRIVAVNTSDEFAGDSSQLGGVSLDANGNVFYRADNNNSTGPDQVSGNNLFRTRIADRDCGEVNLISTGGTTDATDGLITSYPEVLGVPNHIPARIAGGNGLSVNGNAFAGTTEMFIADTGSFTQTTGHLDMTGGIGSDHRGSFGTTTHDFLGNGAAYSLGLLSKDAAGETRILNVTSVDAAGAVTATRGFEIPFTITDNDDGFIINYTVQSQPNNYTGSTLFRGGVGHVAIGRDQAGRGLMAAMVNENGFSDDFANQIVVCRYDANTGTEEWTLAAYVDQTNAFNPDVNTSKVICDADGNTIGMITDLPDVTGGLPLGPGMSAPAIDSAGNIWFLSAVKLLDRGPNGEADFDGALLRAIYDPDTFSYKLEMVLEVGQVFAGANSGTNYRIGFLGSSTGAGGATPGTIYSSNIAEGAWNNSDISNVDPADPITNGGLIFGTQITYDTNDDGLYNDPTSAFFDPSEPADESYSVGLYVGYYQDSVPCPADLNDDGVLDFFDISFFLSNMVDFNEDTVFDFFDISAFLGAYGAGCP
ncbi:MAG: hypothetical protein JJ974_07430 [Phycisphaerales bacterium]|nr:hypothetical protein [Phycisphaerales bacterium]